MAELPDLWTCHLGTIGYAEALELQRRLRAARQAGEIPDTLVLLEHPPVYTRGRRSVPGELPMGEDWYRAQGIEVLETDRGGKVTYHGPGQLVGYPIVRIGDVIDYLRTMEDALSAALAEEGIVARGRGAEGREWTGVWVQERKIASIGLHVSRGVTTHGFAVNVENDLRPFEWVVPCGLDGVRMTSVLKEIAGGPACGGHVAASGTPSGASAPLLPCFRKRVAYAFAQAFGRRQRLVSRARLEKAAPLPLTV